MKKLDSSTFDAKRATNEKSPHSRRTVLKLIGATGVASLSSGSAVGQSDSTCNGLNGAAIADAIGKEGQCEDDGVYRVEFPRTDLNVTSRDVQIEPALALGSWTAFREMDDNQALVVGDLVLTEEEYNQVISSLQDDDIGQTAIHKHLPEQSPPLWWTHIKGMDDPAEIAESINTALEQTETPMQEPGGDEQSVALDTDRLDEIIGHEGESDGGVYKYSIELEESVSTEGVELTPAMGAAIPLNFQPTGDGQAVINGDFAMTTDEVNPVIGALRDHDIEVVSIHNHLLAEEPRFFFLHFWANDDAESLAEGLRAALDETGSAV